MPLKLVETPKPPSHVVQFYGTQVLSLVRNVAYYLADGFDQGSSAVAIVRDKHQPDLVRELQQLGVATNNLGRQGRLFLLDADETLAEILTNNHPDPDRFDSAVGALARGALSSAPAGTVRIYGEMAGILWAKKNFSAAMRLEQLGNQLLKTPGYKIFCSYSLDVFDPEFRYSGLAGPLSAHTHVMPTQYGGNLDTAVFEIAAAMLGLEPSTLRNVVTQQKHPGVADMSQAEAAVLWLHEHVPEKASKIVDQTWRYLAQS